MALYDRIEVSRLCHRDIDACDTEVEHLPLSIHLGDGPHRRDRLPAGLHHLGIDIGAAGRGDRALYLNRGIRVVEQTIGIGAYDVTGQRRLVRGLLRGRDRRQPTADEAIADLINRNIAGEKGTIMLPSSIGSLYVSASMPKNPGDVLKCWVTRHKLSQNKLQPKFPRYSKKP